MLSQRSASKTGQNITDASGPKPSGTDAGDSIIESLTNTTSNLAITKPDAVQGDDLASGTPSTSPTLECELCRKWLTTEPWMRPDFVPVEEIFTLTTRENGSQPFSLFTNSARSGCRGCKVLVEGASLYAQSIGRKDPESIRFNQNLRLYAKLFWGDEDTGGVIQTGIDTSEFEYFVPHGQCSSFLMNFCTN
jgi:hypothetical protein